MGVRKHGAAVYRSARWQALRHEAKRRDGFKCSKCGSKYRLEVHHLKPVRAHPELAFTLDNLQTLCARCHTLETRRELGQTPAEIAGRDAWMKAVRALRQ